MKTAIISLKQHPIPHYFEVHYSYHDVTGNFIIQRINTGTWEARQAVEQSQNHPHFEQWIQEACEVVNGKQEILKENV